MSLLSQQHVRCHVEDSKTDRLGLWRALGPLLLLVFTQVAEGGEVVLTGTANVATCVGLALLMAGKAPPCVGGGGGAGQQGGSLP